MNSIKELLEFCTEKGIEYRANEPMSNHTTFKTGGAADAFILPKNEEELTLILAECRRIGIPFLILGSGSNLLVSDNGIEGAVICLGQSFGEVRQLSETSFFFPAGIKLATVANTALANSLTGAEFAHGIPGSLGGAVYMNAGAYGGEMSQIIAQVHCVGADAAHRVYTAQECGFYYRHSRFHDSDDVIVGAVIELKPGDSQQIRARMDELMLARKTKQPLEYPSAGSTFKRPMQGKLAAAALIEKCGLKGRTVGGAQVSDKHSGFIVNRSGATTADILALVQIVRDEVLRQEGIELELEVRTVGRSL